ncbi:conserved hypothetical protein [Vibrio chagasii]|nr:conserved hypothetical protein [Vibrio chagasii]CAH6795459.1 conserved hypothetical protein [Vibrio chagasii]CAH7441644.1 conserved hypothetical protein [Vibrio chagasii]CAH7481484.1 conserved hypothetical protein [Vibrio chagasii]
MEKFEAQFVTNAGMKDILGRGLINDDSIAIIELVKNAKDAGSPSANIFFNTFIRPNSSEVISEIVISDFGKGMSESDINYKWLNIAYSEKRGSDLEYAGNKGVGRFSCDRLGQELLLYTKSEKGDYIKLPIDWTLFEDKDINDEISNIKLFGEKLSRESFLKELEIDDFKTGTILKIRKVRANWNSKKLKKLLSELEKFSPSLDSTFDVFLKANKVFDEDGVIPKSNNGKVNNSILDKLNLKTTRIYSEINECGKEIKTELYFQDELIYSYIAENPYRSLSNIKVDIHYLDTISKAYFKRKTGVRAVDYGSIFLFYNGFRISPYGNAKNDWLGLDQRKSQGSSRNLGTREVFGRIDISDTNKSFSVITSREGLAHNEAYYDLVAFDENEKTNLVNGREEYGYITLIIRQLENFVVGGLNWNRLVDSLGKKSIVNLGDVERDPERYKIKSLEAKNVQDTLEKILKSTWKVVSHDFKIKVIEKIQKINSEKFELYKKDFLKKVDEKSLSDFTSGEKGAFKKILEHEGVKLKAVIEERDFAEEKVNKAREDLFVEKEKNQYLLNSRKHLSPDAESLIHTVKLTNSKIKTIAENLIEDILDGEVTEDYLIKQLSKVLSNSEKALKMTHLATNADLDNSSDFQNIDIIRFVKEYTKDQSDSYQCNIDIMYSGIDEVEIRKVDVLGLSIVFDNLISNSEKWGASTVDINFERLPNGKLKVTFSDDGKGVSNRFIENPDSLFELGVREIPVVNLSGGSGIGLYHVKENLKNMDSVIYFFGNGKKLSGASFVMEFV